MEADQRDLSRITSGMDLYDRDANKVGTIAQVHRRPGTGMAVETPDGTIEVKTGFFGLGKHFYIPFSAVRDLTEDGVFLSTTKADMPDAWQTRPADLDVAAPAQEVVAPRAAAPVTVDATAVPWEEAMPRYRARWLEHYGASGASWDTYQDRYKFTWDMAQRDEFKGRSWVAVQPELRRNWEVLYPLVEWDQVSDTIRDAWEHTTAPAADTTASPTAASA
jgi:hypothetical protein